MRMLPTDHGQGIRILVIGDTCVGKTSLILSRLYMNSEFFDENPPLKLAEVTIPSNDPQVLPTTLVDYSARIEPEADLVDEIQRSHVVLVVYAVNNPATITSLSKHWLPYLRYHMLPNTPVFLVGNKSDLSTFSTLEEVVPLMSQFIEIESCIEVSAKSRENVLKAFNDVYRLVLFPTTSLYNSGTRQLTDKCYDALERIFEICDTNGDGLLDDDEMSEFQRLCYDADLQREALLSVKQIIYKNSVDGIVDDAISLTGFILLQTVFIQNGKHMTTWEALSKFGYDRDLNYRNEYLNPELRVDEGWSAELNELGIAFLSATFRKYDKDMDGALSPPEFVNLFSSAPYLPWDRTTLLASETNANGHITYRGFLSQWMLLTRFCPQKTLQFLAYLGLPTVEETNQARAVNLTPPPNHPSSGQPIRNVFHCLVIGGLGSGKTEFCQGLLRRHSHRQSGSFPKDLPAFTVQMIPVDLEEKYVILQDVSTADLVNVLPTAGRDIDAAALLYDVSDPNSFSMMTNAFHNFMERALVPVLFVGTNQENGTAQQNHALQPLEFTVKHSLHPPLFMKTNENNGDIYAALAFLAANRKYSVDEEVGSTGKFNWILPTGIGVAVVSSIIFFIFRFSKGTNSR